MPPVLGYPFADFPCPVFFDPSSAFLRHLLALAKGRRVIDVGAGCANLVALDLWARPGSETVIQIGDALEFQYREDDLVILARTCRGAWVQQALGAAHRARVISLYVGLAKNLTRDLDAAWLDQATHWRNKARKEGEIVLQVDGPQPDMKMPYGPIRKYAPAP